MDINNKKFVAELAANPVNPARPWECTWRVAIESSGRPLLCGKNYPGKKHLQSHVCQTHKKRKDKADSADTADQNLLDEADEVNSADGAGTADGGTALDRGGTVEGQPDRSKGHIDDERFPPFSALVQLPQAAYLPKVRHYERVLQPPPAAPARHPQAVYPPNFRHHENVLQPPLAAPVRNPQAGFPPNFRHHENFLQPPPAAPVRHPQAAYPPNFQFAPMPYVHVQPPISSNPLHLGHHSFDPQIYNRPGSNDPYSCILCYPCRCFCGMAGIPGYGVPGPRVFALGGARRGGFGVRGARIGGYGQYYR